MIVMILFLTAFLVAGCAKEAKPTAPTQVKAETTQTETVASGPVKDVTITASNWKFDVQSPELKVGDRVRLHVKSVEGTHGFSLPSYNLAIASIAPG